MESNNRMIMNEKKSLICIGVFLLIIGSLFYLINLYTPMCGDDYLYSFYLSPVTAKSFFEGTFVGFEQKISSIANVFCSQYNHYFYVNGRTIPHMIEQLFAGLWGEGVFNLVNVFFFLLLNMLVIWVSDERKLFNFFYWVITAFLLWFLLPWPVDVFLLMSGAVNYTWSAVFCLIFILVYYKIRQIKKANWLVTISLLLLGLFSGWTHESLVVGISGALFVSYLVQYKRKPGMPEVMLVAGFWLGTLLLCMSPAARGRAALDHSSVWETSLMLASELRAFYILLILLVCLLLHEKRRGSNHAIKKFVYDNQLYFYIIFIEFVFSLFIGYRSARQLWGIELFSIVLSMKLIGQLVMFKSVYLKGLLVVAASVIVVHMACVIPYVKYNHAQFQGLVASYIQSESGIVYFKQEDFPHLLDSYIWRFGVYMDWEAACVSVYYAGHEKPMTVLPTDKAAVR